MKTLLRLKMLLIVAGLLVGGANVWAYTPALTESHEAVGYKMKAEEKVKEPILTLKGKVGEEVTLTLGVYDYSDNYSVDFGDGTLKTDSVGYQNGGVKDENGNTPEDTKYTSATKFTGTVSGDGIIKVYGKSDIWYFLASGNVMPTTFDQPKLMNVVQMSIAGADVESVVLPAYEKMTQFSLNNSSVKSVDVTKVTGLTSLTINQTTASMFEPQLESIDLSKNTELTYLSIQGVAGKIGKLSSIDLTANTKLEGIYLLYNQLTEVKLADVPYEKLGTLNVQNNKLTAIDVSKCEKLAWFDVQGNLLEGDLDLTANTKFTNVYVNNNKLTSVKVADVTKQFYVDGNNLTLATIPAQPASLSSASKTKQFHYAPQAALEVALTDNGELDLTSQLTVAKGELNPDDYTAWLENATTTYGFVTADGTALVEGTDYEVVEPGKFKFVKAQTEKVHGVMLNSALPKFTEAAPFVTTEFTVDETVGIQNVNAADAAGKVYNLQGVEVKQPQKGLYIQNGKKVIRK